MKEIEIQPMGSYLEIDKDGYVVNPASLEKIQEKWMPVVTDVIDVYKNQFGQHLKNVYIRGSVAKGKAIDDVSDIDSFCYVDLPKEQIENSWKEEEINRLKEKYPFIENAELICHSTSKQPNNILLNQSVCVYGEPVQVPKLKPGKEMMIHLPYLAERTSMVEEKLQNSKSEKDIKATCIWYMKDLLRTGFELTMERSHRYTRDLYVCYKDFSEYYPEKETQMREVLHLALNPTDDLNKIIEIMNSFMPWLTEEVKRQS